MTQTIPVLWVSRHPDILARGYADQGLLESLLDRSLWRPPDALEFTHHIVQESDFPDDIPGALVILPARHHASPDDVAWLHAQLARLQWSVLLLSGDEDWSFPWAEFEESSTRKVWIMQPRPEHAHLSGLIPGGWYPGTKTTMAAYELEAHYRPLDWFFAGQVTHSRREECVAAFRDQPGGRLAETSGYLQEAIPQAEYWRQVCSAKFVPCPSGPCTVDTARAFEALEAGSVPLVDVVTPRGEDYDYWALLFGPDHRLPVIRDWADAPALMADLQSDWTAQANTLFAMWQRWKRDTSLHLDDDIREVAELGQPSGDPNDLITVIVTTSPVLRHPATDHIEQTIQSVRDRLPHAEIIVAADGVRPEQSHLTGQYQEYLRRLLWLTNHHWTNVFPLLADEWMHQANLTRLALTQVRTPLILFVEHDCPLVGDIDWDPLCEAVLSGKANMVRFHHETTILPDHRHLMLGKHRHLPLTRTCAWWQRPHLSPLSFYEKVLSLIDPTSRTMIEDVIYGMAVTAYQESGRRGWEDWKLWIYTPEDATEGNIKRSTHLDSREGAEKYGMVIRYPEGLPTPVGSPYPSG